MSSPLQKVHLNSPYPSVWFPATLAVEHELSNSPSKRRKPNSEYDDGSQTKLLTVEIVRRMSSDPYNDESDVLDFPIIELNSEKVGTNRKPKPHGKSPFHSRKRSHGLVRSRTVRSSICLLGSPEIHLDEETTRLKHTEQR